MSDSVQTASTQVTLPQECLALSHSAPWVSLLSLHCICITHFVAVGGGVRTGFSVILAYARHAGCAARLASLATQLISGTLIAPHTMCM